MDKIGSYFKFIFGTLVLTQSFMNLCNLLYT